MNILFYAWGSHNDPVTLKVFEQKNIKVITYTKKVSDYHADSRFAVDFIELIHKNPIDLVFSYNYFPIISMICDMNKLPYVSWILDCPMSTTYSKTITNECNYIFNFDAIFAKRIGALGAKHSIHMPLGGYSFFDDEKPVRNRDGKYACDISFVGSLYTDVKNWFRQANFDDFSKGYLDGIIEAQKKVYGYNFIRESLSDEITDTVVKECGLELSDMFDAPKINLAADALGTEVTAREREEVLDVLTNAFDVDLYTKSPIPDSLKKQRLHHRGTVDYEKEMPLVFRDSKINLNITSKTIESGIPLRVLDIMSCGGFCLTNYQPEIAEYFEDGVDLVMYTSIKDLVTKAAYYLEHEEERAAIAESGFRKSTECFNLDFELSRVLDIMWTTGEMPMRDTYQVVNDYIQKKDMQGLREYLAELGSELTSDNNLSTIYYLSKIYEIEKEEGVTVGIFDGEDDVISIVKKYNCFRRLLKRLEWWDEFKKEEALEFMVENNISTQVLSWTITVNAINPSKVWGKLK